MLFVGLFQVIGIAVMTLVAYRWGLGVLTSTGWWLRLLIYSCAAGFCAALDSMAGYEGPGTPALLVIVTIAVLAPVLVAPFAFVAYFMGRNDRRKLGFALEAPNTFYLFENGAQSGPFHLDQVRAMWRSGQITSDAMYCPVGGADWTRITTLMT